MSSLDKFTRQDLSEFLRQVENDKAQFVGYRYCQARLAAFVERQRQLGEVSNEAAEALLEDVAALGRCAEIGKRWGRWVRYPPPEMEMLLLARNREAA